LTVNRIVGDKAVWFADDVLDQVNLSEQGSDWFDVEVQVRAHGVPVAGRARAVSLNRAEEMLGQGKEHLVQQCGRAEGVPVAEANRSMIEVELSGGTLRGVAAGQSLVIYSGTRVLGQATVVASDRKATVAQAPVAERVVA
jgi:tRNA-specific 2-thiouridylase